MKRVLILFVATATGCAAIALMVFNWQAAQYHRRLADQQGIWQAEKAELQAELTKAKLRPKMTAAPVSSVNTPEPAGSNRLTPTEIIARLQSLNGISGGPAVRHRQAIYWCEELVQAGPGALPAIREFLSRFEELDLDTASFPAKGGRDRVPLEFTVPPSLRFGLFDILRRIGGDDAEKILAENLTATGRGVELAYLTQVLHELAPSKYREAALQSARELLTVGAPLTSASPLDKNHRDYLFGVLSFYGDKSFYPEAQAQLVRADHQIDRSALKYLQQILGPSAVPILAQAYQNPLLADSNGKEPLARVALNYVGLDPQANEFYNRAINDPTLTQDHRRNLIEDLNQDGFPNTKKLTADDLPLIENRISLIEQLAPSALDETNTRAFQEAYKDLLKMRERVLVGAAAPTKKLPGVQ
jgi:hypothetical protein